MGAWVRGGLAAFMAMWAVGCDGEASAPSGTDTGTGADAIDAVWSEDVPGDSGPDSVPDPPEVPGEVSETEICGNGLDDDADGLTDCLDPACSVKPGCAESQCGDGWDNDSDGLADCKDPDCAWHDACKPESCASYFECLAESGCGCTYGIDCPIEGTGAHSACQQACSSDMQCRTACLTGLSPDVQRHLSELSACVTLSCATGGFGCFVDQCLTELAMCFMTGEVGCHEFIYGCLSGCSANPLCASSCFSQVSPQGYVDFVRWTSCASDLCDSDGDGASDSVACRNVAGFFACLGQSGSCIPSPGAGDCTALVDCVLHCESLGDQPCLGSCLEEPGLAPRRWGAAAELFQCALSGCGTGAAGLTPACLASAFTGPCASLVESCDAR